MSIAFFALSTAFRWHSSVGLAPLQVAHMVALGKECAEFAIRHSIVLGRSLDGLGLLRTGRSLGRGGRQAPARVVGSASLGSPLKTTRRIPAPGCRRNEVLT